MPTMSRWLAVTAMLALFAACSDDDDPKKKDAYVPPPDSSQLDLGAADLPPPDLGRDVTVAPDQLPPDMPPKEPDLAPPDMDVTGPTVIATNPADQAQDGPLWSTISATFSEPIDTSKATNSSFTIKVGGLVSIPGKVVAGGDIAAFTPAYPLCPLTSHQGTLTTAFTDLQGNPLAADYTWTFTTVDGQWSPPTIGPLTGRDPAVAIAENGDVFVVRSENDHIVVYRRSATSTVWDAPKQLDTVSATGYAWAPTIAADAVGNAVVAWAQDAPSPTYSDGFLSRYDATTKTWSAPQAFESSTEEVGEMKLAMGPTGVALLVFIQGGYTNQKPYASYYDGTSWSAAAALPDPGPNASSYPVAVAREGINTFHAAWIERVGAFNYTLRSSRFDGASKTWSTTSTAVATNLGSTYRIALAAGPAASYLAYAGPVPQGSPSIYVARYAAGSWGTPTVVAQNGSTYVADPAIATDLAGNALVAWYQSGVAYTTYAASSSTWAAAQVLTVDGDYPSVALDGSGNGFILWSEWLNDLRVRHARFYGATRTVGPLGYLTGARDGFGGDLRVAANACGQAVGAWSFDNEGPISPPDVVVFR